MFKWPKDIRDILNNNLIEFEQKRRKESETMCKSFVDLIVSQLKDENSTMSQSLKTDYTRENKTYFFIEYPKQIQNYPHIKYCINEGSPYVDENLGKQFRDADMSFRASSFRGIYVEILPWYKRYFKFNN